MEFSLEPEHEALAATVRGVFAREFASQAERIQAATSLGTSLGWPGMFAPESLGGQGGSLTDTGVLAKELGKGLACGQLQIAWLGILLLLAAGQPSGEGAGTLMYPAWVAASVRSMCAGQPLAVESGPGSLVIERTGDSWQAQGATGNLLWPEQPAGALAVARTPRGSSQALVLMGLDWEGLDLRLHRCVDGSEMGVVSLEKPVLVHVAPISEGDLRRAHGQSVLLWCAEMVGAARAVLEMTVSYVKDRHQFGRPIGSFQAVQHQLADVLMALDAAELATEQALATTSHQGDPLVAEVSSEVAIAASLVAFREATLTAHQLHGGIGFVSEHPLHCYSDRYLFLSAMLGGEQASYARLGPKVLQRRDNQGFF